MNSYPFCTERALGASLQRLPPALFFKSSSLLELLKKRGRCCAWGTAPPKARRQGDPDPKSYGC